MNTEVKEALSVVKAMFADITTDIKKAEADLVLQNKLVDQRRTDFVNITIPDLSSTTFLSLVKTHPGFAERHYVAEMFERFQPKRFLFFWTRQPKADATSLSMIRLKFDHWLIDNDEEMFDAVNLVKDHLEQLKHRQAKLAELMTILVALEQSNRPLPDDIKQKLQKLQKISNNYPNHPISDDFHFEEDWSDIFDLATELFIVYEAFQNDAFASELIPEQLQESINPVNEVSVDNFVEIADNNSVVEVNTISDSTPVQTYSEPVPVVADTTTNSTTSETTTSSYSSSYSSSYDSGTSSSDTSSFSMD